MADPRYGGLIQVTIVVAKGQTTKMLTGKNVIVQKIEKVVVSGSRGLQKTELQKLQLGIVM